MTVAKHPKKYDPCPICGGETFTSNHSIKQIGQTYICDECETKLFVYDNSERGMGESLTWRKAQPVIEALGHERKCIDCGYNWHYGGAADRPTCPECRGKNTKSV